MPFTLLAHQAPVLAVLGRRRVDGLAIVVGTIMCDLVAVSSGWGYVGRVPLYLDGHRVENLLVVALLAAVVAAALRRSVVPVLPRLLGPARAAAVGDLLAPPAARGRLVLTFVSALAGAMTHVALDALTHESGRAVMWLQVGASLVLGAITWRWLHRRVVAVPGGGAGVDRGAVAVVAASAIVGLAVGVAWGVERVGWHDYYGTPHRIGAGTGVMTVAWVVLAAVVLACVAVRAHQPRSIHSWR